MFDLDNNCEREEEDARLLNRSRANEIVHQAKGTFHVAGFATRDGREPSICLATCWRGATVERFEIVGIYVPARVAIPRDGRRWCNRRVCRLPNQAARHLPQNAIRALASI